MWPKTNLKQDQSTGAALVLVWWQVPKPWASGFAFSQQPLSYEDQINLPPEARSLSESLLLLSSLLWKDEGGFADRVCRVFMSHRQDVLEVILYQAEPISWVLQLLLVLDKGTLLIWWLKSSRQPMGYCLCTLLL